MKTVRLVIFLTFLLVMAASSLASEYDATLSSDYGTKYYDGVYMHAPAEKMEEWNEWKFGMFIHWGAWSQAHSGAIWDIVRIQTPEQRVKSLDLYKTFNPVKYDPKQWAKIAKQAGMKYVVFTTKHHDGFCNFETTETDLKVTNPDCPYSKSKKPDILKELVKAYRAEGIKIGFYFSHIDWYHHAAKYFSRTHWQYDETLVDTKPEIWEEALAFETAQINELMDNYGPIDIFWFDISMPGGMPYDTPYPHPRIKKDMIELVKMMRQKDPQMIINNRGVDIYGDFSTPEQRIPEMGIPGYWESNITITNGRGFWYKGPNPDSKSAKEVVHMLLEITGKGGNFLLNVGPAPDGTITPEETKTLKGIGDWLEINGESIYGTTGSPFRRLDWGKCTIKGSNLYLHVMDWPKDGVLRVPAIRNKVKGAYLLADKSKKQLKINKDAEDLLISVGKNAPDEISSVVVLTIVGKADVDNTLVQSKDGSIELVAGTAEIIGKHARYFQGQNPRSDDYITKWSVPGDYIKWEFKVPMPGTFDVTMHYASKPFMAGSSFTVEGAGQVLTGEVKPSKPDQKFISHKLGQLKIAKKGTYTVMIKPGKIVKNELMEFKKIVLIPSGQAEK